MVILASFKANFWFAFLAGTTLVLSAAYTLWMVKRVVFGDIRVGLSYSDLEDRDGTLDERSGRPRILQCNWLLINDLKKCLCEANLRARAVR